MNGGIVRIKDNLSAVLPPESLPSVPEVSGLIYSRDVPRPRLCRLTWSREFHWPQGWR